MTTETKKRKHPDEAEQAMEGTETPVSAVPPSKIPKQGKDAKESSSSDEFKLTLKRAGSTFVHAGSSSSSAAAGSGGVGLNAQTMAQKLKGPRREPKPTGSVRVKTPLKPAASVPDQTVIAAGRSVSVFLNELSNPATPAERVVKLKGELKKREITLRCVTACTNTARRDESLQKAEAYLKENPLPEDPPTPPLEYDEDGDKPMAPTT